MFSTSPNPIYNLLWVAGCFVFLTLGTIAVYRLSLHPCAKFPGPKLWAITRLPYAYHLFRGDLPYRIAELHRQYGSVVRVAPFDLSFTTAEAWNDIYGKQPNKPQLAKDPLQFLRQPGESGDLLFEPDDVEHGRMRRNFSHAFSEKSLRDQEPIIDYNIGKMITRLREVCDNPIDISAWLNFVTFDVIGDLVFGDSFHCLDAGDLHPWVENLFNWVSTIALAGEAQRFWPLNYIMALMAPKNMKDSEMYHRAMTKEKLDNRLRKSNPRPDFISAVHQFVNVPYGLRYIEIFQTCAILMTGGSETTATVLSGTFWYLLSTPDAYKKMVVEIRSTFKNTSEITMATIGKLTYTLGVVNEGLRLSHPVPGNLRRITPAGGCDVSGWRVPSNTLVAVDCYSAFRNPDSFHRADEMCPERWLADPPAEFVGDKLKVMQGFSVGPRNCIGKNLAMMEMRLLLAHLFLNFDFKLTQESVDWLPALKVYGFIKRTPFMIKVTPVVA